jgi:NADH-quinone oxidoreductase subunit M
VSGVTAAIAVLLAAQFDWRGGNELKWGYAENVLMLQSIRFGLKLGCDSVSLWLVLLTAFLTPLAIWSSFASIREREKQYYAWMLLLLVALLGVFVARDLLLFYVFFELTLIPMFFIIGIWGGPERRYAAAKFFLFTFAGSVFTLTLPLATN